MLAILLKVLSVLGIILLALLGILFLVLLLVLFFPILYRVHIEKNAQHLRINGRVSWLFGLVKVKILYPDPGTVIAKFLWFTLYDSGKIVTKETSSKKNQKQDSEDIPEATENSSGHTESTANKEQNSDNEAQEPSSSEKQEEEHLTWKEKLFAKYEKIKYTLKKFYDKIKHILENIAFYKELLQDEETQGLISHGCKRLEKIFRSILPRKLKADIIFGTGSPDTTGYAFGVYGMMMPKLGKQISVTPDFTQKILEGQLEAAGHITVFTLLRHALAVLFDKRLWLLKNRLKAHKF